MFILSLSLLLSLLSLTGPAAFAAEDPVWDSSLPLTQGIALKSPTHIYTSASTSSKALKSYSQGTALKYQAYTSSWYKARIFINGQATIGYISASDVENVTDNPQTLRGIALKTPTNMYSSASAGSKVLKTYQPGTVLTYKTFTSSWYQARFYVNGKAVIGYLKASDAENLLSSQQSGKGLTLKNPTIMHEKASLSSKTLKSYEAGKVLVFKTFSKNWYEAKFYVNGIQKTGYLSVSDAEKLADEQKNLQGIGKSSPTKVYSTAYSGSKVLRSYEAGTILKYKTLSASWMECNIFISGKATTGYIKKSDLENLWSTKQSLSGVAMKSPTKIYSKAAAVSKVLKSYSERSILKYSTLSDNWFETSVYISGVKTTGYIKSSDVQGLSYYDLTYDDAVSLQMKVNPQTDSSGSWKTASSSQVKYYVDPGNFIQTSSSFYQFLTLSKPAGTDASEINNTILKSKGILTGKASSYLSASKTYGVNEIYLISHSLLETGNGSSTLSNGILVKSVNGKAVTPKTVYNMYGIGAKDSCPERCGSEYAYSAGWFTPEAAIIGGAKFIGDGYVNAGQDTLYKMRWNPDGMVTKGYATHQYATDIGWAFKQTSRISQMYAQLSKYTMQLDVPTYLIK
ncbi:mannosyl-glycoprotein endo-beta-N-acetylglucosaminidase [Bacillus sp. OV322]|uniref:N-acetylglucosaminidase n=1 Tax=Bacillus sp. OV322 TaxID=1882764 RepID=UPI0008E94E0C|nr:N-acetylglucosaminidase [Bacillus sp. OV322]SFC23588.1 mannosyl-glycoprotein endo-beta-N-acetylglucosaminidase [Bacillus sp. OV322]